MVTPTKTLTPYEILTLAQERIKNPEHWCQKNSAKDAFGNATYSDAPDAVQWCAYGTIWNGYDGSEADEEVKIPTLGAEGLLEKASRELFQGTPVWVNDKLGHAAVMQMFDRARELAAEAE